MFSGSEGTNSFQSPQLVNTLLSQVVRILKRARYMFLKAILTSHLNQYFLPSDKFLTRRSVTQTID